MDIRIGGPAQVGSPPPKTPDGRDQVEARVLSVRPPRRRRDRPPPNARERRQKRGKPDPAGSRVLVLMIPDGQQLPKDLQTGPYRVFLRFVRR